MDFSNVLLMSDVDGTLMLEDGSVPKKNVEAIRYFVEHGGRFSLATGRSIEKAEEALDKVPVNFPGIFINGGMIIETDTRKVLERVYLEEHTKAYIKDICREFPDISVYVLSQDIYITIQESVHSRYFVSMERMNSVYAELDDIMEPIYKALFIFPPDMMNSFIEINQAKGLIGVRFVTSADYMAEMLPITSSKGVALKKLAEQRGIQRENIVAVGDQFNDIEMLEYAGLGIAVGNAPEGVKEKSDMVLGHFSKGIFPQVIALIEERNFGLIPQPGIVI